MGTGTDLGHDFAPLAGQAVPALGADAHVWAVDLDELKGKVDRGLLGPIERAKAETFVFELDRQRYIAAHVALRMVLARYTSQSPDKLDIRATPQGKPYLCGRGPAFNLSHSAGSALVAVAAGGHVGVDLEHVVPRHDALGIARSLFSRRETELLAGMDEVARRVAFHRLWVCREAVLKAAGTGLAGTGLEVGLGTDGETQIIKPPDNFPGNIVIREFAPSREQRGAVAWTVSDSSADAHFFGFSLPQS